MMNKYCFIADDTDEGTRLDNYLSELFADTRLSSRSGIPARQRECNDTAQGGISRAKLQDLIKRGNVLVNNQNKKPAYKLKAEDKIDVETIEEKENIIHPQDIPLDIVYEDENMLVVNKPSGMLTHPTAIEHENTLVNALLHKYGENLSDINGYLRRGILHRLDRNTSGLLMIAKNNEAHEFLAKQIKEKTAVKKYLAIVKGVIKEDFGALNYPIDRNPNQPHKMAVVDGGKASLTEFKVLKRFKNATYLELDLKTGRTHQIRVHLSYIKHPIVGDSLYGGGGFKVKTQEQALQSYKLSFTKPCSNDIIELELEPDDKIKHVLTYLENLK